MWKTWVRFLGWEDPPGGGHGNSLQYSCLKSPMDRGAWRATVHRVPKSRTQLKQVSTRVVAVVTTPFQIWVLPCGSKKDLPVWAECSEHAVWGRRSRSLPSWFLTVWAGNKQEPPQKWLPRALLRHLVPLTSPRGPAPRFLSGSWVDKVQWGWQHGPVGSESLPQSLVLVEWTWAGYSTNLNLNHFICKMEIIRAPTLQDCCEN